MDGQDKEFVEYVVKALVTNPDAVVVNRSVDDMGVLLELTVDPADMGKVIGKAGATAKSIRTLLRVLGAKNDARVNLKIVEPEGAEPRERTGEQSAEPVAEEPVQEYVEPESDLREKTQKEIEELADLEL
ncbi:MAG TPA: KH domain-containing protein [Candidatus Nanoarchaeia archaeon]|nr:KH domain-containing protein [Candidatus Nanoarchaeia archaeon]